MNALETIGSQRAARGSAAVSALFARYRELEEKHAGPAWLQGLRADAKNRAVLQGFPTTKMEPWRQTSVTQLAKQAFLPVIGEEAVPPELLEQALIPGAHRLVFVNGVFSSRLSQVERLPSGVVLVPLSRALELRPDAIAPHLGRKSPFDGDFFAALNTAFLREGAFLSLPRKKVVAKPIQFIFVSTATMDGKPEATVSYPRILVIADQQSQASVVETYIGPQKGAYLTNALTEIVQLDGSKVELARLIREGAEGFHISRVHASLATKASAKLHSIALSGEWTRNDIVARLTGEGSDVLVNGLYGLAGEQKIDHHTTIEHERPGAASAEHFRGVLDGRSQAVFQGRIKVAPDAQKSDARQSCDHLLLSGDATAYAQPQLEIYADDVKCTHGATVGELDTDALFYLRSRGISQADATAMLTAAFLAPEIDRIGIAPVRKLVERAVAERFGQQGGTRNDRL